jgi:hypothetical protein
MLELGNVYNPNNKPVEELPKIFAWAQPNGFGHDVTGQLLGQNGEGLGSHWSSSNEWAKKDLGFMGDNRFDRHETFRKYYPDGYAMYWLGDNPRAEPEFLTAMDKNRELANAEKDNSGSASAGNE